MVMDEIIDGVIDRDDWEQEALLWEDTQKLSDPLGPLNEPGTTRHSCDRCDQQPQTAPQLTKAAIKGMRNDDRQPPFPSYIHTNTHTHTH